MKSSFHQSPRRRVVLAAGRDVRKLPRWKRVLALAMAMFQFNALPFSIAASAAGGTTASNSSTSSQASSANVKVNKTHPKLNRIRVALRLSNPPTDPEITKTHLFEELLAPVGGTTTASDNEALGEALTKYLHRKDREDYTVIENFVETHASSPWRTSLLTNLGILYRQTGYYTKALDAWEEAWKLAKNEKGTLQKAVADRAATELTSLLSSLGRTERLGPLLDEIKNRPLIGPAATQRMVASEALGMMKKRPEIAFKCGPYALNSILAFENPKQRFSMPVMKAKSTAQGFSLEQVAQLSAALKMNYQVVKRANTDVPLILPAVVHWKSGHFAAILKQVGDHYLVQDPTFGHEAALKIEAINDESSGYFLVPPGKLPGGWSNVSDSIAQTVYGRGFPPNKDPKQTKDCSNGGDTGGGDGGSCGCGMPGYTFSLMLASLKIHDFPMTYTPPVGPSVKFGITYNMYEMSQTSAFTTSNLGSCWTNPWQSFIRTSNSGEIDVLLQGGGWEINPTSLYTGDSTTGNYGVQMQGQSQLFVMPTTNPDRSDDTNQQRYERRMPDGSKQVFDSHSDSLGNIYLTQIVDPQGNHIDLAYEPVTSGTSTDYQLVSITDSLGQVTTLAYGLSTASPADPLKITQITDPFGRSANFGYTNVSGIYQLTSITDVVGMTSTFTYSTSASAITSITTPYGTTSFNASYNSVDASQSLIVTDPRGGQEEVFSRYGGDLMQTVNEPLPNINYAYTGQISSTAENSLEELNTYYWSKKMMQDAPGDLTKAHVYHWLADSSSIGASGIPYCEKAPLESRIWYYYGQGVQTAGESAFPTQALVGTSDKITDKARLLDDGTTQHYQYQYNSFGQMTESIDPTSQHRTTNYDYDTNGIDLLKVRQTTGGANDVLQQITYYSTPTYPPHLRHTVIDASGQTTTFTYNSAGQIATVTNPKSEITTCNYDSSGYLQSVTQTDPVTSTVTTLQSITYDGYGRLLTSADSAGYTLTYEYDALNRVVAVIYPDGTYTQSVYDKLDVAWSRDRLGRWTHNIYDSMRHLITKIDPLKRIINYGYCICGALISLTDANLNTTSWQVDLESRVVAKIYSDQTKQQYVYENSTSRLKTVIDPMGQMTNYTYLIDNDLAQVSFTRAQNATPGVSYAYDTNYNRILVMTDGTGDTDYTYNPYFTSSVWGSSGPSSSTAGAGQLGSIAGPLPSSTIAYGYDQLGRHIGVTINGGSNSSSWSFDYLGRITSATNNLGAFTTSYDPSAPMHLSSVAYPNGQETTYLYSPDQWISEIQNLKSTGPSVNLSKFDYTFNTKGDILAWTRQNDAGTATTYTYDYDAVDQLASANLSSGATVTNRSSYVYDPAGNRTGEQIDMSATSATYNNANQLTGKASGGPLRIAGTLSEPAKVTLNGSPATVTQGTNFDGYVNTTPGTNNFTAIAIGLNGTATTNGLQVVTTAGTNQSYSYDKNGNLLSDGTRSYEWDVRNRVVAINNGDLRSEFTYDGLSRRVKIVEKSSGAITSTKQFVWNGDSIAEERAEDGSTVTKQFYPQGEVIDGISYYYTRDHLGSVREMTDSSGTIKARYDYDPFGRMVKISGSLDSDFQYVGYYLHPPSGLNLTKNRAYDPGDGRWLSRDPLRNAEKRQGPNLYEYVQNDPIDGSDPTGLGTWNFDTTNMTAQMGSTTVDATYTMDANESKCCHSLVVDRSVDSGSGGGESGGGSDPNDWLNDNSPGMGGYSDPANPNIGHAEPDNPQGQGLPWFTGVYRTPSSNNFYFKARCTSGPWNGSILSTTTRTITTGGHVNPWGSDNGTYPISVKNY